VVAAIVTAVAYMASLLAHELAHSLVARRNGPGACRRTSQAVAAMT